MGMNIIRSLHFKIINVMCGALHSAINGMKLDGSQIFFFFWFSIVYFQNFQPESNHSS